jgi:Protein of unknown function, DUF547
MFGGTGGCAPAAAAAGRSELRQSTIRRGLDIQPSISINAAARPDAGTRYDAHVISRRIPAVAVAAAILAAPLVSATSPTPAFDSSYAAYGRLLARVVHDTRVDYQTLAADRTTIDDIAGEFAAVAPEAEEAMSFHDRMSFWINAYNLFTLRVIVDHYPIRGSWFSLSPRNSIRQIEGVWTTLKWRAASRDVTLDDIEHRILRPEFAEPRIHMAINCASKSCPPLRGEPYVGADLDRQLDDAARGYLASAEGVRVINGRLYVSRIFEWYGSDFVKHYAAPQPDTDSETDRAIRGFVERYGPPDAADAARSGAKIRFLDYDWSLNDVQ